jgi:hypothetical protein
MIEQDKAAFRDMMFTLAKVYNKPLPEKNEMAIWYGKLAKYELRHICKSVDTWVDNYKYTPTINDILNLLPKFQTPIYNNLLNQQSVMLSKEENKVHSDELLQLTKSSAKLTDHKAWAKKILAKPLAHIPYAVKCAQEALNMKGGSNGI